MPYTFAASIGTDRTTVLGPDAEPAPIIEILTDLRTALQRIGATVYSTGTAHSTYTADDGTTVLETSVTATGATADPTALRLALQSIGYRFDQESVGLILQEGTDTLLPASPPAPFTA